MRRSQSRLQINDQSHRSRPAPKSNSNRSPGGPALLERIEIAGCIASGKTTLVNALAGEFGTVYEDHTINPFWEAFYTDPAAYTFETEITFLLQHYHFAKVGGAGQKGVIVLDHSFELDMAYAEVGLVGSRRDIFKSIYQEIQNELGPPRVLIFITCGAAEAASRIRGRARSLETELPLEFLSTLQRQLEIRIAKLSGLVPIIHVDSEKTDFRKKGSWLATLISDLDNYLGPGRV